MKRLIKNILFFLFPLALVFIPLEIYLRQNTFKAKAEFIKQHQNEIEWLVLGSSHNWRAINPALFQKTTASLAFGGSAIDIDIFLANHYLEKLPQLKRIILEVSYHSLEERRGYTWGKNHLLWVHFGIAHYNGPVPWYDYALLSSQPLFYGRKLLMEHNKIESGKYNEYGFINVDPDTSYRSFTNRFQRLNFNANKIKKGSEKYLANLHKRSNLDNYQQSLRELDKLIEICKKKEIAISIISPPKYFLYQQAMNEEKYARRNAFLNRIKDQAHVQVLVYDAFQQNNPKWFSNENHLNVDGANQFTRILEKDILKAENRFYLP